MYMTKVDKVGSVYRINVETSPGEHYWVVLSEMQVAKEKKCLRIQWYKANSMGDTYGSKTIKISDDLELLDKYSKKFHRKAIGRAALLLVGYRMADLRNNG